MSDERLGEELKRYGLEGMAGNPVDVLLRHIYANHEAALGAKDGTIASLESQNQALQAALREVGLSAHVGMFDTCPHPSCVKARNALSLTQETDPRMRCPDCGKPDTINHTEFEGIGWMQRSGDPDDCGWHDCATQETDPE
jgi:hypothetical protein